MYQHFGSTEFFLASHEQRPARHDSHVHFIYGEVTNTHLILHNGGVPNGSEAVGIFLCFDITEYNIKHGHQLECQRRAGYTHDMIKGCILQVFFEGKCR